MTLQSDDITKIAAAMVSVQAEIGPAIKGKANPFFKSKYADLSEVWDACRDALQSNEIAVIQGARVVDGKACMETKLVHTSGQWFSSLWEMMPAKADPQSMGSAITYMRRYSLSAMVGILAEDDDGNAASRAPADMERNRARSDNVAAKHVENYLSKPILIPVPDLEDEKERWKAWARAFVVALDACKAPEEVDQWIAKNGVPLGNLGHFSETAYNDIQAKAEKKKAILNEQAGMPAQTILDGG